MENNLAVSKILPSLRIRVELAADLERVLDSFGFQRPDYVRMAIARQVKSDLAELERIDRGQPEPA